MSEKKPAIKTQNLTKHFNGTKAVESIDLKVERGEVFGLLGPNGAGKTTLVNMFVGLVEPTKGTAKVLGKDIKENYRQVHDSIGLAPTENNFDREFNVYDNLKFHAGYFGFDRKEKKRRAEKYLKKFNLWDKRKEKTYFLSSGMRKKLLIARAMISDPEILILDEPTAALDVETRRMIHDMIKDLADQGLTIILTTHYIEEAEKLCERVAIMDEGKIIANDSPSDLIEMGRDDRLLINLSKKINGVPKDLNNLSGEINLINNKKIEIRTCNANKLAPRAIKELYKEEIGVQSININNSDLEDIFYDLT